jgi:release factor glutamine methyltransferase
MISARVVELGERLAAAGIADARAEAWLLLAAATGCARGALMAGALDRLTAVQEERLESLARRRVAREPMAYILGEKEFWSLPFAVGPAVLIPRPESETVVEAALAGIAARDAGLEILDLGTGSGCLLLALLSELPRASGVGVDVSAAALGLAQRNAVRLGLAGRARLVQGSWGAALSGSFDLIVANPPYVTADELRGLAPEVRAYEPESALAGGPDGLDAYRALAPDGARLLAPHGRLLLEIGQSQGSSVLAILAAHGLTVTGCRRDLAGIERCLIAQRIPRHQGNRTRRWRED